MSEKYILAFDQGTTNSRAIIFNKMGEVVASSHREFAQIYPRPSWVEQDPLEIWNTQLSVAKDVMFKSNIDAKDIISIGITNQRETTIIWDRKSGNPIYNAIGWQDRRTSSFCDELKKLGYEKVIKDKTGLEIDSYFSATKIRWILDNISGAQVRAEKGELCFGTVDSWILYRLSGNKIHYTDVSNASRSMLFDINSCEWDNDLLNIFNIPFNVLPKVKPSSFLYGKTQKGLFSSQIPISGMIGDQSAALFGQLCTEKGMVKTTYGTGCFMMMNVGDEPVHSSNKLLSTIAWELNGKVTYALEGSVFIGGAIVQWLRDQLSFFNKACDSEKLAESVEDNGGVYVVPALTGLGAPHWDQSARGLIIGLTRGSTKEHITRAALESICYQVYDLLIAKERDTQLNVTEIRVDGGAVPNNFMLQFQADILEKVRIIRPQVLETTALGAAFIAGIAIGYWNTVDDIKKLWKFEKDFSGRMPKQKVDHNLEGWNKAIKRSKSWDE